MIRNKPIALVWLVTASLFGGAAHAEIADAAAEGFTTTHSVTIDAERAVVWSAAVDDIGRWWHPDHTISGDASRLSMTLYPQGCFCENLGDDAGVVHMAVTMVSPQSLLRLTGGLGPLGLMGVSGNMTWEFTTEGDATRLKFTYAVGGYSPSGLDKIAAPVDFVIGEALQRLKAHIETGDANNVDGS